MGRLSQVLVDTSIFIDHLRNINVVPFDVELAKFVAHLHAALISQNQDIGFRDTVIAASALYFNFPILTLNQSHFSRIKNLELIDVNSLT
ncbi:MAG: type II toxin-antitoxin system VapC family toxin [Chloroherpetonaceae bacterium]